MGKHTHTRMHMCAAKVPVSIRPTFTSKARRVNIKRLPIGQTLQKNY